jgi:hypothetical protein
MSFSNRKPFLRPVAVSVLGHNLTYKSSNSYLDTLGLDALKLDKWMSRKFTALKMLASQFAKL